MIHPLSAAQRDFIDLLVTRQALLFGEFTLKSGRSSPYFINTGCFHTGGDLERIGSAYAATLREHFGASIAVIFGPAYKGIPLALATAQAYERQVGRPVGWSYDRKEAKTHGDGGGFVGAPLRAGTPVVMVDDVITAGTALREAHAKLTPLQVDLRGAVVSVDREEIGQGDGSARSELAAAWGVPVVAIISITSAVTYLAEHDVHGRRYVDALQRDRVLRHVAQGQVAS
jgi:orotate phosphoribosyltransferase